MQTHFCRNSYCKCHKRWGNFTKNVQCYHISCFVPLSNTVDWFRVLVWEEYLRFNNTSFLHVINPSLHSTQGMSVFNTLRTGDADLRFYVTTLQDGWRRFAFLTQWNSVHLQVLLSATPQGGMFPEVSHSQALLGSLVSISWKFQFTKIVSEFVINF